MTDRPNGTPEEMELPEAEPESAAPADLEDELDEDAGATSPGDDDADALGQPVAIRARPSRRRGAAAPIAARAPTVSEVAVHVSDPASKIFVIGTVVVFVAILLFGIFLGNSGILTGTPTPRPSAVPTASPSAAPSASGSVAPSASASAAPSASASAAPSPSEAPSASPSPS